MAVLGASSSRAETEPARPDVETVRVVVGDITLTGSLRLPAGSGPFGAVVIHHGSEPGRRENRAYVRWADLLVERGIAALTTDKRGVGDSGGEYVEGGDLSLLAGDLQAWAQYLAARQEIRADGVGTLGWSQGGWVGPLAASRSDAIAFVVTVSGPGVSPLEQNIYDKTNRLRRTGAPPERVQLFERAIRQVWTYLATGEGHDEAAAAWAAVEGQDWLAEALDGPPMGDRDALLRHPRMTHFVVHQTYDPRPALESLKVPMLAVFGGDDPVVPVERSVAAMREAFRASGNDGLTVRVFPGGDHGVRVRNATGQRVIAPELFDTILDWVEARAGT